MSGHTITGFGTIVNSAAILAGGLIGRLVGRFFLQEQQDALNKACGVSILFIAIAGAMEGMLRIEGGAVHSGKAMLVVLCLSIGTIIGELIGIERGFEHFGEWLKQKTGNARDKNFVNAIKYAQAHPREASLKENPDRLTMAFLRVPDVKTAVAFQLLFIEVYNGCLNDLVLFAAVNGFKGLRQCC